MAALQLVHFPGKLLFAVLQLLHLFFHHRGSRFSGKCHWRQTKISSWGTEHKRLQCEHRASERAKEYRKKNTHRVHEKQMSRNVTSLPASMVSLSLLPSSEPEATMALNMSPVARWQTQYCSASRGACRERERSFRIHDKSLKLYIITTNLTNKEKVWLWILTLFYPLILSESQPPASLAGKSMKVICVFETKEFLSSRDYLIAAMHQHWTL